MLHLQQKAKEVKDVGAAMRRNWNPTSSSVHYRIYKWWTSTRHKHIDHENFCHYWRVVLVWAPLLILAQGTTALAILAILAVAFMYMVTHVLFGLGIVVFIGYFILGANVGGHVLFRLSQRSRNLQLPWLPWLNKRSLWWTVALVIFTLPVVLLFVLLFGTLLYAFSFSYQKVLYWVTTKKLSRHRSLSWVRIWHILLAMTVACDFALTPTRTALIIAEVILVPLVVLFGIKRWRGFRKARHVAQQRTEKKATADPVLRRLFAMLHPHWVDDDDQFNRWYSRYASYCRHTYDKEPWEIRSVKHYRWISRRYAKVYGHSISRIEDDPEIIRAAERALVKMRHEKRSFISDVRGLVDFVWSVLLTKKWKICPRVILPED